MCAPSAAQPALARYFDWAGLECASCVLSTDDRRFEVAEDGLSCECGPRFAADGTGGCAEVACADGEAVSDDGQRCLPCGNSTTLADAAVSADCGCANAGEVLVERNRWGQQLGSKECAACPAGTYADAALNACVACEAPREVNAEKDGCVCSVDAPSSGSEACFDSADQVEDALGQALGLIVARSSSKYIADHLPYAAWACHAQGSREGCQMVGNMCVLELYDSSAAACALYTALRNSKQLSNGGEYHNIDGWSRGMPWLYYEDSPSDVRDDDGIVTPVSFAANPGEGYVSTLQFSLSVTALNGTWLGLRELSDELALCRSEAEITWRRFGTDQQIECQVDVTNMAGSNKPVFYDLWYQDGSADSLYPVPILVRNLQADAVTVNDDNNEDNDQFVRRMFVADALTSKSTETGAAPFVTFASELSVLVRKRGTDNIFVPEFNVRYSTINVASASSGATEADLPPVMASATWDARYTMDFGAWTETFTVLWIVGLVLATLAWLFNTYVWARRQQNAAVDGPFMLHTIALAVSSLAQVWSLLTIAVAFYWLVAFKLQESVWVVMPEDGQISGWRTIVIVAAVGMCIHVLAIVLRQSNVDVFFIDWEKPRNAVNAAGHREEKPVSVWRTLFMANEYAELQTLRVCDPNITFVLALLLLEGARWGGVHTIQPDEADLRTLPVHMTSDMLRFAIGTTVILLTAFGQWLVKVAVWHRFFGNPMDDYIDMLSVANISLIMFDDRHAGYYLHGRSLMPEADCGAMELNRELRKEAGGVVGHRGLTQGAGEEALKENQCFEVYITRDIRARYDAKLTRPLEEARQRAALLNSTAGVRAGVTSTVTGRNARAAAAEDGMIAAQMELASMFRNFVNTLEANAGQQVRTRTLMERVATVPPELVTMMQANMPVFYHDFARGWTHTTFYGVELQLTLFNAMVYGVCCLATQYSAVALFVAWVSNLLLTRLRTVMGTANVANKALVDSRFLK